MNSVLFDKKFNEYNLDFYPLVFKAYVATALTELLNTLLIIRTECETTNMKVTCRILKNTPMSIQAAKCGPLNLPIAVKYLRVRSRIPTLKSCTLSSDIVINENLRAQSIDFRLEKNETANRWYDIGGQASLSFPTLLRWSDL